MSPDVYHSWLLTIGFVLFYKVYSKHLDLLEKYLINLLHSQGFPFLVSQCLRRFCKFRSCLCLTFSKGGSEVASKFSSIFPAQYGLFFHSNILGGICSCRWVFGHMTARLTGILLGSRLSQSYQFYGEFPRFLERLLRNCEQRPVNYAPCILFCLYFDGEGFGGLLPFSPVVFLV